MSRVLAPVCLIFGGAALVYWSACVPHRLGVRARHQSDVASWLAVVGMSIVVLGIMLLVASMGTVLP